MKIFKQFFEELKEYLQQWFSAERELWLARIAGFVSFILIFVFLIFVWKDHQPSLIKNLPKTINRLIRYFVLVLVFLLNFYIVFWILKFFFLEEKMKIVD